MTSFPRFFFLRSGLGIIAGLAILIPVVGCGSGAPDRKAVSGTVKYKGVPVAYGSVQFSPAAESKATTNASADIRDGKYSLTDQQGLMPGKYQVRIFSSGPPRDPESGRGPGASKAAPPQLPPQYNIKTKLAREVSSNGPNNFDFDLK